MNAERLLAHYEKVADAPDAIARLRRFILDLAVRGKLVSQDANDEPASELLKRIVAEKARLGLKNQHVPLEPGVAPFELPIGWSWSRIGEVCSKTGSGSTPRGGKEVYKSSGVLFLRSQNVYDDGLRLHDVAYIDPATHERMSGTRVAPGDLLLNITGGSMGRCCLLANDFDEANISQHVTIIRVALKGVERFLHRLVLSPYFQAFVFDEQTGAGRGGLPKNRMDLIAVALPPLAEQHRIVVKVDELMGLCDRLEAARAGREAVRDRLAAASLARLNATDPKTFEGDARFAFDALSALTARADQIKALRQTILNLAVRGKLVSQDANDEPASELLKRIAKEKTNTGRTGALRETHLRGSLQTAIAEWDLPSSWMLVSVSDVLLSSFYGPRFGADEYISEGVPTIRTTDMTDDGRVVLRNPPTVSIPEDRLSDFRCLQGDLLVTRTGSIGTMALFNGDYIAVPSAYLIRLRFSKLIDAQYLYLVLRSPSGQNALGLGTTRVAQPNINAKTLAAIPVPLPPLAEQHRIVARVDELMTLCDRLEVSLSSTAATRSRLLNALLAEALTQGGDNALSVNVMQITAKTSVERKDANFTERSAYILSLAYERHRTARRDRSFGHVKAQKILHLVEAEAGFELGRTPVKDAAGPNDFQHMLAVEEWALRNQRFAFEKNGSGYSFKKLPNFQESLRAENQPEASKRKRIERIIEFFVSLDMKAAELVATVYAAWNNLLIEGKTPTDAEIVRAARDDWHPSKLKIPSNEFFAALKQLRSTELIPEGAGKFVHGTLQRYLFD